MIHLTHRFSSLITSALEQVSHTTTTHKELLKPTVALCYNTTAIMAGTTRYHRNLLKVYTAGQLK